MKENLPGPQLVVTMAKRKRNNAASNAVKKQATANLPSPPQEKDIALGAPSIHAVTSPEEMEIAVETLQSLTEHPALIKSKACKDLRAAVYNFRQASTTGMAAAGTLRFCWDYDGAKHEQRTAISQHAYPQHSQMASIQML